MVPLINALLALAVIAGDTLTYNGRAHALRVQPPRIEARIQVDGVLDEPVWAQAARMTGFSSYFPTDDRPAQDSTEVLVWYSSTAIHFGVRAYAAAADVRSTLATRDNLTLDDFVAIFLSTFNDQRQAFLFGANPLGVQADGTLTDVRAASTGHGDFRGGIEGGRPLADLSPDFLYRSKGRITPAGFEIEFEIPFKSLRFQTAPNQVWGINVERTHRATGAVSVWAPAKRDAASYLTQSGTLEGLTDLHRGLVLDVAPVVTSSVVGTPGTGGGWDYRGGSPRFGADIRWGVTPDLTANGTIRPDFSQIESDAGQVSFDPRSALFFPEKRPFFLDGSELFQTSKNLVYSRRIVEPVAAAKLSGKVAGTSLGFVAAVDDRAQSATGDNPVFTIGRVQKDVGRSSKIGMLYTGRFDGPATNHVLAADGHLTFGGRTSLDLLVGGSRTTTGAMTRNGSIWDAALQISGRRFSFRYVTDGISNDFDPQAGFLNRGSIANVRLINQATFYGKQGGLVERFSVDFSPFITWRYDDLIHGRSAQDHKYHFNANTRFRGGWTLGASYLHEFQKFDPGFYAPYRLIRGTDTLPFVATPELRNEDWLVSAGTPEVHGLSVTLFAVGGRDVNFFEWSRTHVLSVTAGLNWRPSDQIRINGSYKLQQYRRHSDGTIVSETRIPRLKLEYQVSRALFVRTVVEYRTDVQADLRDDGRTGLPIVILGDDGVYRAAVAERRKDLRGDLLIAYQPSPGTVLFMGYGSSRHEELHQVPLGLRRISDGFFVKLSYLFRA